MQDGEKRLLTFTINDTREILIKTYYSYIQMTKEGHLKTCAGSGETTSHLHLGQPATEDQLKVRIREKRLLTFTHNHTQGDHLKTWPRMGRKLLTFTLPTIPGEDPLKLCSWEKHSDILPPFGDLI
jgi:hypothetical protein